MTIGENSTAIPALLIVYDINQHIDREPYKQILLIIEALFFQKT